MLSLFEEAKISRMKDVTNCPKTRDEDKGVTEKLWLDVDGREALFKITRYREDGSHINAHYAELFVSELCKKMDIAAPDIELAFNDENIGCLSYNFLKPGDKMMDFNEILSMIRPDFSSKKLEDTNTGQSYSIPLILEGLEAVTQNPNEYAKLKKQFLNYCMLYSIIEHYDVNPSNISVIKRAGGGTTLAPMFDNGTSLNLSVPEMAVAENLSPEWLEEIRPKNKSKIGTETDKRTCSYDELQEYILSKYYNDVDDFVRKVVDVPQYTEEILSTPSFCGLGGVYVDMINMKLRANTQSLHDKADKYRDKAEIEKSFNDLRLEDIENGFKGIIPEAKDIAFLTQHNKYHCFDVDQYCTKVINLLNTSELSDENRRLVQWAVLFNELGKGPTHQISSGNDTFRGYSSAGAEMAQERMEALGFEKHDREVILGLIKSHDYREVSDGSFRSIINCVGERNLEMYFVMKECENACKNPELKRETEAHLDMTRFGIVQELETNNREIIKALPVTSKSMISLGLAGQQIGMLQEDLANFVRGNDRMYAYYKARGHMDKYKKDLFNFAKVRAKEIKDLTKEAAKETDMSLKNDEERTR